jgi:glyceraldehyde-3-phosphate dehydrogenase/erythrose-4-phosphate dehydrogenase
MTVRVGVNGFGRIGRNSWRAVDAQRLAIRNPAALHEWGYSNRLVDITGLVASKL